LVNNISSGIPGTNSNTHKISKKHVGKNKTLVKTIPIIDIIILIIKADSEYDWSNQCQI
jgi:hypothetical protein